MEKVEKKHILKETYMYMLLKARKLDGEKHLIKYSEFQIL